MPKMRCLTFFAFANAVRSNLNFILTQSDMPRGAQAQSRLSLVDIPTGRLTRHEVFIGVRPPTSPRSLAPQALSPGPLSPMP